ncbi:MAG: hypothetical protein CMI65_15690, partial [Pedosphaera sp.]|nr:hypothetical protein [Pedosphaera sp.]
MIGNFSYLFHPHDLLSKKTSHGASTTEILLMEPPIPRSSAMLHQMALSSKSQSLGIFTFFKGSWSGTPSTKPEVSTRNLALILLPGARNAGPSSFQAHDCHFTFL